MKSAFKVPSLLLCALLLTANVYAGGGKEYTKTIKKEFPIVSNGLVNITNKYGKVAIKTWDRERVKIEVRIRVKASSEKKAQQAFDRISVNFSNGTDYVKAETEIGAQESSWWNWSGGNDSDFNIDYQIQVPKNLNLELSNKYGDIIVPSMDGWAKLWVKYGNFKVEEIKDDVQLDIAYGNGSLKKGQDVILEAKYSNLSIGQAEQLKVNSKHTNVSLEKGGDVSCTTKYDNYTIGEIAEFTNTGKYDNFEIAFADEVNVNTKYSHLRLKKVGAKLDLNMEYGDAIIGQVERGFTKITLDGRHTDFKLGMERGSAFQIDAAASYAGIRYPKDLTVTYEVEKGSKHQVKGHLGQGNTPKIVKARLSYGGLRIDQN